jgi:hypothetical protein
MPKVKYEVLDEGFEEILVKLYKEGIAAKILESKPKEVKSIELTALFTNHMEELRSLSADDSRIKLLVKKINEILDQFSELFNNEKLKAQINDAYRKRNKSKNQTKVTLNNSTVKRLKYAFASNGIKGPMDDAINALLTALGVDELFDSAAVSESVSKKEFFANSEKLDVNKLIHIPKGKIKGVKKWEYRKIKK